MQRRAMLGVMAGLGLAGEDWPQFRGPSGQGISSETGLALEWSATRGVKWKTEIPGSGWSSPVVAGDTVWLTAAGNAGDSLRVLSVEAATGKIALNKEVIRVREDVPGLHAKNRPASPTVIVDGERVYAHFGYMGTVCLQTNGNVLWRQTLRYEPQHGPGGSPALHEDMLIISCDGFDAQFVVALDTATGKVRWKTPRRKGNQAYTTPLVIEAGGQAQAISPGAHHAYAYEPKTGKEIWWVEYGDGFSNVPRAVYAHGLVYICTGFFQPQLLAVRPDGKGNVTRTHVAWSYGRSVPLTPSPIVVGGELYMVSDNGVGTCLDAKSGKMHWQQRIGGNHSASPVFADGRLYFLSEEGECTVIAPGTTYRELARNSIGERTLASLGISGKAIYLRGEQHLYRIEA